MTTAPAASAQAELTPPAVDVPGADAPVRTISADDLKTLGDRLFKLFGQYASDRRIAELRWLRNQRQYLGIYDPEIEKELAPNRSRAYPRVTRVKCISVLARLMNLMFQGDEKNWSITASPNPEMSPDDIMAAINTQVQRDKEAGIGDNGGPALDEDYIRDAVQVLADERAKKLTTILDDQLQELGGDQTVDYVALNRKAVSSGILYGLGVLRGPFVREQKSTVWSLDPTTQKPVAKTKRRYKPQFETLPVWDFYPDMSAKTFQQMDGYFIRLVMSRAQVRKLADRPDFFADQVKKYLTKTPTGNYKPQPFETDLRAMGVKVNVNEMKQESTKYEIICWHGPVDGHTLQQCGVEVKPDMLSEDIDAEVWMVDGNVIKATMNPWKAMGADVKTIHTFLFDEDDTSPVGQGLPNIVRDTQMSISASTRMLLDNASVVCGPNLELNTDLLRADQDLTSVSAYKIWYREGDDQAAQFPAVRNIQIDGHLKELTDIIRLFMEFGDMETFVGPQTGGDMSKGPSEPFRTAAGASMLRGDAALPFKDIVRSFDQFTQSIMQSLVVFNRKFNPDLAPEGDYNVIARGATSLMAKEVRGMQVDQLAATLSPEEKMHVDERKLIEARLSVRDLQGLLVSPAEAERRKQAQSQAAAAQQQQAEELAKAQVRKLLSDAFKNISQGQKNSAASDAQNVDTVIQILEHALGGDSGQPQNQNPSGGAGAAQPAGNPGGAPAPAAALSALGGQQGPLGIQ